ncbi:MAG TPA: PspC domain-containing protein [Thermoleophilaceae bacterium]|nr:PspC domain-containing protein [Thermoleophilaceae bacterium]
MNTEPNQPQPQESRPQPGPEAPPRPRKLLRSRSERVLGGVCGGLGRYFNVDPIIFRIAAIALVLLGGAGLLLYLAAVLLVPAEDSPGATAPAQGQNRALVVVGVVVLLLVAWPFLLGGGLLLAGLFLPLAILVGAGVLAWWLVAGEGPSGGAGDIAKRAALGIGVLIGCALIALCGAWAAAAGGDTVVAILVIGAGLAVLAGAFLRPVRWLILPAVSLALAAGFVSAAGLDLDGGVGEREYRPASSADLHDRYELGMGELVIDLRDTDLPAGDVPLELDLGIGAARVLVPEEVCVAAHAELGMGEVRVLGRRNDGIDVDYEEAPDASSEVTRLVLDAEVGIGELRVSDGTDFDEFGEDRFGFGPSSDGFDDEEQDGNRACAATGVTASG